MSERLFYARFHSVTRLLILVLLSLIVPELGWSYCEPVHNDLSPEKRGESMKRWLKSDQDLLSKVPRLYEIKWLNTELDSGVGQRQSRAYLSKEYDILRVTQYLENRSQILGLITEYEELGIQEGVLWLYAELARISIPINFTSNFTDLVVNDILPDLSPYKDQGASFVNMMFESSCSLNANFIIEKVILSNFV